MEKLGVEFEKRDGLFYPLVDDVSFNDSVGGVGVACAGGNVKTKDIGKYGHLWINFMQEIYPKRYRSLARFGLLEEKSIAVNEEAYELLCAMGML